MPGHRCVCMCVCRVLREMLFTFGGLLKSPAWCAPLDAFLHSPFHTSFSMCALYPIPVPNDLDLSRGCSKPPSDELVPHIPKLGCVHIMGQQFFVLSCLACEGALFLSQQKERGPFHCHVPRSVWIYLVLPTCMDLEPKIFGVEMCNF